MRNRTTGREMALRFLFMLDIRGDEARGELTEFLSASDGPNEARHFAKRLVEGYLLQSAAIDRVIDDAAENWDLKRMATVDRNILRIAAFELVHSDDTPARVAINEAIEIGKKYGSSKTASFVNGILDRIRRGADQTGAPAPRRPSGRPPVTTERTERTDRTE